MSAPRPSEAPCGSATPHPTHPMPCDSGCQPDWHRDSCAIYGTCPGLHVPAAPRPSEADVKAVAKDVPWSLLRRGRADDVVRWLAARDAEHEREWDREADALRQSRGAERDRADAADEARRDLADLRGAIKALADEYRWYEAGDISKALRALLPRDDAAGAGGGA